MTRGQLGLLTVTHVAAIGLGVGMGFAPHRDDAGADQGHEGKTDRKARTERRVSERDLLAAYEDSSVWGEVAGLRQEKDRADERARRGDSPTGEERKWLPPEERAAKVTHLRAAMDEQAELVRTGKGYDAGFSRALIRRWMAEDPEACMAWLGQMNLPGIGWQDPFSALFEGKMMMEPLRALEIMGTEWLPKYKRSGMTALARHLGRDGVDELAPVLEQLEGTTRSRFLRDAMAAGHAGNLGEWLELVEAFGAGESEKLFVQLAEGMMPEWSSRPWDRGKELEKKGEAWKEENAAILEVAAGTPAEEIFANQWQKLFRSFEVDRLRRLALRDPGAALEGMTQWRIAEGEDAATARKKAAKGLGQQLEKWEMGPWEDHLQGVVLGSTGMSEALADRFARIDSLPAEFREATGRRSLMDALWIEPGVTVAFAVERGMEDVLGRMVRGDRLSYRQGKSRSGEILIELMGGPIWEAVPQQDKLLESYARDFLAEDPEGAVAWLRSIPSRAQREAAVSLAEEKCREWKRDDLVELLNREFSERK